MTKIIQDCVIASATGYDYSQVERWITTLQKTGYSGDIVITGTNLTEQTVQSIQDTGASLHLFGKKNESGDIVGDTKNPPHVERFFYIANVIEHRLKKNNYRFVISTDIRDVIFQSDPTVWLESKLRNYSLVASSEGMKYENEPWGNQNLYQSFGPYFHNTMKLNMIQNVGVLAGRAREMHSLMTLIYQLSLGRPIPIVDQAVYNFLLTVYLFNIETYFATNEDNWAIQLGTTEMAVASGHGDLGQKYKEDMQSYHMLYEDVQPRIGDDNIVRNSSNVPYCIVHQWDRIPQLKNAFEMENTDATGNGS